MMVDRTLLRTTATRYLAPIPLSCPPADASREELPPNDHGLPPHSVPQGNKRELGHMGQRDMEEIIAKCACSSYEIAPLEAAEDKESEVEGGEKRDVAASIRAEIVLVLP